MQDKTIPDSSITASSVLVDPNDNTYLYQAALGRLENDEFWAPADNAGSWVQVDFGAVKRVNGIRTQGSVLPWERWVEALQVHYGNSTDALKSILEDGSPKVICL